MLGWELPKEAVTIKWACLLAYPVPPSSRNRTSGRLLREGSYISHFCHCTIRYHEEKYCDIGLLDLPPASTYDVLEPELVPSHRCALDEVLGP